MKANAVTATINANGSDTSSTWAHRAFTAARFGLAAILLFGVANAIFNFAPQPPLSQAAQTFIGGLFSAPYFFLLLKGTETLVALALLTNFFVPLAAVVLAPITINIVLFHLVLAPTGAPIAIALLVFHLATIWSRRENYREVFAAK